MVEFEELQKVLGADSQEEIVDLAVERITELTDSVTTKDKEIAELTKKLADSGNDDDDNNGGEGEDEDNGDGDDGDPEKGKKGAKDKGKGKKDKGKDEGDGESDNKDELEKLKAENEDLKKKLEEAEAAEGDALDKLGKSVKKLQEKTDAIGQKQVRTLWNDADDEIDKLKEGRMKIFEDAHARGGK